jgi:general nucleoside transport system ATP-binding protein
VIIVSSELDEIYALSDRIAVMYEGKITGFRSPDVSVTELGLLMAGAHVGDLDGSDGADGAGSTGGSSTADGGTGGGPSADGAQEQA